MEIAWALLGVLVLLQGIGVYFLYALTHLQHELFWRMEERIATECQSVRFAITDASREQQNAQTLATGRLTTLLTRHLESLKEHLEAHGEHFHAAVHEAREQAAASEARYIAGIHRIVGSLPIAPLTEQLRQELTLAAADTQTHAECSTCHQAVSIWTTYDDGTIACAEHRR